MNTISAVERQSAFCDEPHLNIVVDGTGLDEAAGSVLSEPECRGLVPCLLPWHEGPDAAREMQISVERFLPAVGSTAIAPVLMCPDDLDFSCTVIVAEIVRDRDFVRWTGIGLDQSVTWVAEPVPPPKRWRRRGRRTHLEVRRSGPMLPDRIGSDVKWAEAFPGWVFDAAQYRSVVDAFRSLRAE